MFLSLKSNSHPSRSYGHSLLIILLICLGTCRLSEQQQNRRSQSSSSSSSSSSASSASSASSSQPAVQSQASSSNNQALRSSSQQRAFVAASQAQNNQGPTPLQQANRNKPPASQASQQNRNNNKPADSDSDQEDSSSSSSDVKFECPRPDGLFADPASCKRFILCGSSHPWQQTCPPGLYFDSKLKFCTFKTSSLTCGPVSDEEEVKQDEATQDAQDSLPTCDNKCKLPDCFCSADGTAIPGGLQPNQVPQMILLSFSGAVNELVFDHYKKILGYSNKYGSGQSRLNPNGCGIKSTFFVSHEYTSYAQVHWLAAQQHEIGLHSISHRMPELWWTDKANYSDWVEEMIGMREILLQLTNINGDQAVIKREDMAGMRAPFIKPGGDNMYQMLNDFGLTYSSSIVAPKADYPLWPFTLDSKVPFDCANVRSNKNKAQSGGDSSGGGGAGGDDSGREGSGRRQRRHSEPGANLGAHHDDGDDHEPLVSQARLDDDDGDHHQHHHHHSIHKRIKRQSTFAGKSLKCPTKSYPGIWEVPLNPLTNEISTCHHLDQCVFPSQDDHSDSSDIVNFLIENFERHYNTTRAPFQINIHVQWVLNQNRVKALTKFIDHVSKAYPNVYFVNFKQMLDWVRTPTPASSAATFFKCDEPGKVKLTSCNRPQTCVVKLNTDNDGLATTQEQSKRSEARYLQICPGVTCPKAYPWFGNLLGSERNLKTVLELVQESTPANGGGGNGGAEQATGQTASQPAQGGGGGQPQVASGPQPS